MTRVQAEKIKAYNDGDQIVVKFNVGFDKVQPQGFVLPKKLPKNITLSFPSEINKSQVEAKILGTVIALNNTLDKRTRKQDKKDTTKVENFNSYFSGKIIK